MALGIVPSDPDSATKAFADLKTDLDNEKAAQKAAQIEVDTLARAVKNLKILGDKFATQIPTLEDKVKYLKNKVVDGLNEVRAQELCLERTTQANDNYQKQNAQLTKKMLDSPPIRSWEVILANMRQSTSLTLRILKSLYPRPDMDAAGEGFVMTCSDEEAFKLVKDSAVTAGQVVDMFGVEMSLG
jgi:hypothetical protein